MKNWDRSGREDERGTLNFITPAHVARAAALVRDLARAREEQRWEFMVVATALRLPGGTGSPFNPIAVL